MHDRIILLGYMGAGKTTLGKALAQNLHRDFVDLDWYIEEKCGKKIGEIFAEQGEDEFRKIERQMLHEVAEKENVVIAVGGGTPCFFDNIDFMNQTSQTVYIKASTDTLIAHIHMGKTRRPLIDGMTDEELHDYIESSMCMREPFYNKAKHTLTIETIRLQSQIEEYVEQIKKL